MEKKLLGILQCRVKNKEEEGCGSVSRRCLGTETENGESGKRELMVPGAWQFIIYILCKVKTTQKIQGDSYKISQEDVRVTIYPQIKHHTTYKEA